MFIDFFWTILSGIFIFTAGQMIQEFVLKPVQGHKKVIGEIDNKLKFYAFVIPNHASDESLVKETRRELRQLSCDLESTYKEIPFKKMISWLFDLKTIYEISDAASKLIGLSNTAGQPSGSNFYDRTDKYILDIRKNLDIPLLGGQ